MARHGVAPGARGSGSRQTTGTSGTASVYSRRGRHRPLRCHLWRTAVTGVPREIDGAPVPDEVVRAAEFHTHLGPFLIVGLRMGHVITRALGREPFTVHIRAHTGRKPPYSCTADGLQCSTPCTVGNGGLQVTDRRDMSAEGECDGRRVVVKLRSEVFDSIRRDCNDENQERYAMRLWEATDDELFEIEEVR
ncbi:MAG: hypothetical protein GF405_06515 [Candidatus Eisenbacteria bacterium]|nr:hypothetical protein [Candidatus Eisenbacteria bacterium]